MRAMVVALLRMFRQIPEGCGRKDTWPYSAGERIRRNYNEYDEGIGIADFLDFKITIKGAFIYGEWSVINKGRLCCTCFSALNPRLLFK
jgi:hypothetical protein